jgi:hypothetical protein
MANYALIRPALIALVCLAAFAQGQSEPVTLKIPAKGEWYIHFLLDHYPKPAGGAALSLVYFGTAQLRTLDKYGSGIGPTLTMPSDKQRIRLAADKSYTLLVNSVPTGALDLRFALEDTHGNGAIYQLKFAKVNENKHDDVVLTFLGFQKNKMKPPAPGGMDKVVSTQVHSIEIKEAEFPLATP